jgi:hypothetical protein
MAEHRDARTVGDRLYIRAYYAAIGDAAPLARRKHLQAAGTTAHRWRAHPGGDRAATTVVAAALQLAHTRCRLRSARPR